MFCLGMFLYLNVWHSPLTYCCKCTTLHEGLLFCLTLNICDLLLPLSIVLCSWFTLAKCWGLAFATQNPFRLKAKLITLFVIFRFESHNGSGKNLERHAQKNHCLSTAPLSLLFGTRGHSGAFGAYCRKAKWLIITSLMCRNNPNTNGGVIDNLCTLPEKELIWSWWHRSLSGPFQANGSWCCENYEMCWILHDEGRKKRVESLLYLHWRAERGFWIALDYAHTHTHSSASRL